MSGAPEGLLAKLASLAAEGNGEAAYHLGMAYHLGANGVEKDPQKAFELFTQSAETGDPLGAYMLGSYYEGEGGEAVETNPELARSEEHTSELQSLMRTSYAVFCLKKQNTQQKT